MDLKQLRAFVAIAESQSFSAAAKTSGLSQPSLSRLLKQLETDIDAELIDRYHRPLQLTEAGGFFYDKISAVLVELDTIVKMTKRLATPSNTLNIGFVPSVLYGLLPEIIADFKQRYSSSNLYISGSNSADSEAEVYNQQGAEVNLKDISSYQQIEALKSGEIDVGFGRFAHQDASIQQILLRHERYLVALPKTHPLAQVKEQRLLDLANNRLILYHQTHLPLPTTSQANIDNNYKTPSSENSVTEPLLHLFAQYGITPLMITKVSDLQVALGLVAAGEGITLVPASLRTMRSEQISYQRLIHENVTSPIYLNTRKDFIHPLIPSLLEAIYAVYEQRGITYRAQQFV